jgi:hypothetical protein
MDSLVSEIGNVYGVAPFIHCFVPGQLFVDVYSWEREVIGIGNSGKDWDVDICYEKRIVIPFSQNRAGFRQALRLAKLCVHSAFMKHSHI